MLAGNYASPINPAVKRPVCLVDTASYPRREQKGGNDRQERPDQEAPHDRDTTGLVSGLSVLTFRTANFPPHFLH